jgi:protein-arginine kinase activator protein McsA
VVFTEEETEEPSAEAVEEALDDSSVPTLNVLQKQLEQAIADERYEEAAGIRDKITKLSTSN